MLYVSDPPGMDRDLRRQSLDALRDLNELQAAGAGPSRNASRASRSTSWPSACRSSVPEVMDISREPKETLEAYGAKPGEASFANNCLLARRLVEQGVRFVQLFDWGWDFHGTGPGEDIRDGLTKKCATMDKPVAALIKDLKQRGLLDDTLVIWGGEFGRTPFREGRTAKGSILGRDHYPDCFTHVAGRRRRQAAASATARPTSSASRVAEDKVHVHDLQATILHLLGLRPHEADVTASRAATTA